MLGGKMITGMHIKSTISGFVLYTMYRDLYDPANDNPSCVQIQERTRKTTANDLIEFTRMGYFAPNTGENA